MGRKSDWQQFADNFESVYGTFNKFGSAMETRRIMGEEPEEEMVQEGPRNSYERATGKWNYGGKSYDKEITADELRGLQYNRLGDVMAKYGDPTGAMDMRTKAAGIETSRAGLAATNLSNELAQKTLDFNVEQARLKTEGMEISNDMNEQMLLQAVEGWPIEKANMWLQNIGYKIDNSRNLIKLDVEKQTKDATIKIANLEVEAAEVAIINQKLLGEGYKINNKGNLVQLGIDKATAKDKITTSRMDINEQQQDIINKILAGNGLVLDNRNKLVSVETAEKTQYTGIASTNAQNRADLSTAELEENSNQTLLTYSKMVKDGKFKSGGGVAWLKEHWTGDQATLDVIHRMNDYEVDGIMREGALMIKRVEASMSGKMPSESIPILQKLLDEQDGIPGNLEIKTGEGGSIWIVETDADGNKTSDIKGKNWVEFQESVLGTLTPLKSIEIAQSQANLAKTRAETEKLTSVGLDPDQVARDWNAQRLQIIKTAQEGKQAIPTEADFARLRTEWINGMITKAGVGLQTNSTNNAGWDSKEL
tara:strand:+ start:457 stop:2064 length:1608 start_codon:yes stop_codon:yes gene_type:complete